MVVGTPFALGMSMVTKQARVDRVLHIVETEYLEMPGLNLTKAQMQRLLGVDVITCDAVLQKLEQDHFLKQTAKKVYVRA